VLQPVGVIRTGGTGGTGGTGERYQIIFGERRFRAAAAAGKSDIPVVIYEELSEVDAAILTALENLQREDLDIEDEAKQFAYLLEVTGLSQRALAERLGKTHNYISRRVRLLRERPEMFAAIREGRLSQEMALNQLAAEREVYQADTPDTVEGGGDSEGATADRGGRQVGVYQADTLVAVIPMGESDARGSGYPAPRTPRDEMPAPHSRVPARWQAITRTYRVLGKIQPDEVPIEECEDLAHQLKDLEALVAATRRALQARLEKTENTENSASDRSDSRESDDAEMPF
jgi:ParB/RepB/Spo0J family partition protein